MMSTFFAILFFAALAAIYLFPTWIAAHYRHHNAQAIFVLTLFLGWTILGWLIAMIWAFSRPAPHRS